MPPDRLAMTVTKLKVTVFKILPSPVKARLRQRDQEEALLRGDEALKSKIAALPRWDRRESTEEKPLVRVGFIGAGAYAQYHLQVLSHLHNVQLASILTTGGPRVQTVASNYGIEKVFTDRDAFLAQDDIGCFVLVVPAHHIYNMAVEVLAAGKPVLMEKPAGLSSEETAALAAQAERHGTYGMVCMNRRFYSVVEHGLAALASYGPIRGAVLEVPEAISKDRQSGRLEEIEYERFMFRNSVHAIDLLRHVLGEVVAVKSLMRPNAAFNNAAASYAGVIEHRGGALSTVLALWDSPRIWRLRVIAEHAWLEFDNLENGWLVTEQESETRLPLPKDPVDREFRAGVYAQDLHFLEAVRRRERPLFPACLLPDAYQTNRLIEAVYGVPSPAADGTGS